jgi:hypothetical protein
LLGYIPRKITELVAKAENKALAESIQTRSFASLKTVVELRTLINETYQQISHDLVKAHKVFRTKEAKFEKDKVIHGSLTEQKQQDFDLSKKLFEKLFGVVTSLSEVTGESIPVLEVFLLFIIIIIFFVSRKFCFSF